MRHGVNSTFLFILICFLSACWGPRQRAPFFSSNPFQVPTKDDVLWVDGRRLSLSGYAALRSTLPETLKKDDVLWIATAALAFQNETLSKGKEVALPIAVDLARVALSQIPLSLDLEPYAAECTEAARSQSDEVKKCLEHLITRAAIQRNPGALAELR